MIQQVNLYQNSVKPNANHNGLNLYTGTLLGVLMLGATLSTYYIWQSHNVGLQLSELQQQVKTTKARIDALAATHTEQKKNPILLKQVNQLQQSIRELKQTLQFLNSENPDTPEGFSGYLEALGNQSVTEVWLTSIYIDRPKRLTSLSGSTFKANKIANFLQQLQNESIFEGQSFAKMLVLKSETYPGQLDFKLSTTIEPQAKQDHAE